MAEGYELPRGFRGHAPPEIFWNEYALRCNLVHFETQFGEMLQWYFILFFSLCYNVTLSSDIFWGKAGHFGGETSTPQIP